MTNFFHSGNAIPEKNYLTVYLGTTEVISTWVGKSFCHLVHLVLSFVSSVMQKNMYFPAISQSLGRKDKTCTLFKTKKILVLFHFIQQEKSSAIEDRKYAWPT